MKIYEAIYNPCYYESAPCTLSIHKTKEGAQKTINEHRAKIIKEFEDLELVTNEQPIEYWINDQYWDVKECEIKD